MSEFPDTPLTMTQKFILHTEGLSKTYGKQRVVDNVSLQIKAGTIYG
ncbi:hypothetical protein ACX93W_15285 [Paenibacillus sp. CAU 1782]